jgi:uncharacterized membrane protein YraQ (UPF0718 family)
MGAGLGPAIAFLYSGPAINVLAIILTARILGLPLGIARAVGAISFSIIIGLVMHLIYRKEELKKFDGQIAIPDSEIKQPLWHNAVFFAVLVGILVFANWGTDGFIRQNKWLITAGLAGLLGLILIFWFRLAWWKVVSVITGTDRGEAGEWFGATWGFAKQILPLLALGVLVAGFLLGRVDHEGLIPSRYIQMLVGDKPDTFLTITGLAGGCFEPFIRSVWPVWINFFASIFGAFMYFATLTEVPILQGLIGAGMGQGPALALLLSGPSLSLPSMLVIRSVLGTSKTIVYVSLVIIMSTISGLIFGALV